MDKARRQTDKELRRLVRDIKKAYKEARDDITKKWDQYMSNGQKRLDKIAEAHGIESQEYRNALENITLKSTHYKKMVEQTTKEIANANKTALAYANDKMPEVYSINYNQVSDLVNQNKGLKVSFTSVNKYAVKRLIAEKEINLLPKRLDIPKDQRWNTRQINNSVLQGIIQGESLDKIANRLYPIMDKNRAASIRNARTMMTGAENLGRQDSYKALQAQGVIMKKVWIAVADEHTREWHLDMDGQEVDIDEPFIDGNGNEIMYPGDPSAAPETIYNCRCSMSVIVVGFKNDDDSVNEVDFEIEDDQHDKAIEDERRRRA